LVSRVHHKLSRYLAASQTLGIREATRFEWNWSRCQPVIEIRLPEYKAPLFVRRFESDMNVFSQVFYEHELESFLPANPELIIDAGANVGYTTAFYAHRFPETLIVAVEPDARNFEMLVRNCADFSNVRCLHAALWHQEAVARVANPDAPSWSFQVEECSPGEGVTIPARSIEGILAESGRTRINLLKLDIEGAERELFSKNAERWLPNVDAIALEIHGSDTEQIILSAMPPHQFERGEAGERRFFKRILATA